jgi:hypothetical protein
MAVYIGERKNTRAVRSAMKINYAVIEIIGSYPNSVMAVEGL